MYIKKDINFYDLQENCWSGALNTLKIIEEHNKEDDLMELLEDVFETYFGNVPEMTEINDYLWFEPENIFECLGISESEEEEEEIDCKVQSCADCYQYILGECEGF